MFVRMTRIEGADKFEQAIASGGPQTGSLQDLPGFAGAVLLVDRATNAGITVTYWDTPEALQASEEAGEKLRKSIAQETGSRVVEVDRFEQVIQERVKPPQATTS